MIARLCSSCELVTARDKRYRYGTVRYDTGTVRYGTGTVRYRYGTVPVRYGTGTVRYRYMYCWLTFPCILIFRIRIRGFLGPLDPDALIFAWIRILIFYRCTYKTSKDKTSKDKTSKDKTSKDKTSMRQNVDTSKRRQ
jgi:hypothetical protein